MLEIYPVDRIGYPLRGLHAEPREEGKEDDQEDKHREEHRDGEGEHRLCRDGDTEDAAVAKAHRRVMQLLEKRVALSPVLAKAVPDSLLDLWPLEMVLHILGVALALIEHGAILGYHGDTMARNGDSRDIGHPILSGRGKEADLRGKVILYPILI